MPFLTAFYSHRDGIFAIEYNRLSWFGRGRWRSWCFFAFLGMAEYTNAQKTEQEQA
jgi:hypothetical protein